MNIFKFIFYLSGDTKGAEKNRIYLSQTLILWIDKGKKGRQIKFRFLIIIFLNTKNKKENNNLKVILCWRRLIAASIKNL